MADKDWSNFVLIDDMVAFIQAKYGDTWKEMDETFDEIIDNL